MTLIDVITYDGDNNTLVYKYPHSEFNTLSQLIVHESQEAVFFKNGQMLDSFGPGKYPLHTGNSAKFSFSLCSCMFPLRFIPDLLSI